MTTTDSYMVVVCGGESHFGFLNGSTDGTETEIKIQDVANNLESFGKALAGQTLNEVYIQCSDGSILTTFKLYDPAAGVILSAYGNERTTWPWNLVIKGLNIPIKSGMLTKLNCAD